MDRATRDAIVDRLHANPELVGVPFEVVTDEDGVHLDLDGERLATIPSDPGARRVRRDELTRRYGISLFEADELDGASPEELEKWLYYAAGFKDSTEPIVDRATRRFEARRPHLIAVVRERVRDRLQSPFDELDDVGTKVVRALEGSVERVSHTRESEWSGVPVELESSGYWLAVSVDLPWVDDEHLRHRLDSQLRSLTDDRRADAERMVSGEFIDTVADAITLRWDEATGATVAERVEAAIESYGEAFVSPDGHQPNSEERSFGEAMAELSDRLPVPHSVVVEPDAAYWRAEDHE